MRVEQSTFVVVEVADVFPSQIADVQIMRDSNELTSMLKRRKMEKKRVSSDAATSALALKSYIVIFLLFIARRVLRCVIPLFTVFNINKTILTTDEKMVKIKACAAVANSGGNFSFLIASLTD